MNWDELKKYVYYTDGSLRDIYVSDTTRDDWKIWADYVNTNYRVLFTDDNDCEQNSIDIEQVFKCWHSTGEYNHHPKASIYVGGTIVNCQFFIIDEIENDIDPREFNSLDDHHQLMNFMVGLSKLLDKKVVLTFEDTPDGVHIAVEKDRIWYDTTYLDLGIKNFPFLD